MNNYDEDHYCLPNPSAHISVCMSIMGIMPDRERIELGWFTENMTILYRKYGKDLIDFLRPTSSKGYNDDAIKVYGSLTVPFFANSHMSDVVMVRRIKELREHANVGKIAAYRTDAIYILTMEFWETMSVEEKKDMVRIAPESWIIAHADELTRDMELIENVTIRRCPTLLARFDHLIDWHGCPLLSLLRVNHAYIRLIRERFDWPELARRIADEASYYYIDTYESFVESFREDLSERCFARVAEERARNTAIIEEHRGIIRPML